MMINDYIQGLVPADSEIRELCKPATGNEAKEPEKTTKTTTKKQKTEAKTMKKTTTTKNDALAELLAQQRALEQKIAELMQQTESKPEPETVDEATDIVTELKGAEVKYFEDDEGRKRIAILFEKKPSDKLRDLLKKEWWRYHGKTHTWERNDKPSSRESLKKIAEAM